ncbi:G kinase-anchoring protein 1-like [Thrips palmi]|uniref:G kinase-anchoring protein 1-like n=1 Tax=Thrips palmi TaxID=161013 RepID=A0A6P8Z770_THRPL|nr:G kinase-anchoring protein 1-like [Thrips palmi]XP_034242652.1 G kinase-anchoring protein 1-like [Thrips palmi]
MLGVASRFSVLKIEGEDQPKTPVKKRVEKSKTDGKKPNPSQNKAAGGPAKNNKKPGAAQNGQSTNSKGKGKTSKVKAATAEQWEEWKQKDAKYVDENYEGELQEAILQSKLEFEQNKDFYERTKKELEAEKKLASVAGKKKKSKAMSLDEFNNMQENSENGIEQEPCENGAAAVDDPEFFNKIKEEAKEVIKREQMKRKIKEREPFLDEAISIAQYQVKLEERDAEIASLKEELAQVKEDLLKVKSRNKKLCSIIGQSEVKDKAEILVQLDKLQVVKDELTAEVANLHVQLEQERSKVHALSATDGKGKGNKKRTASETHN